MEANSYFAMVFFRKLFQLFFIMTVSVSLVSALVPTSSQQSDSDRLSLLAIKSQIELDPMGALSSWNDSLHHCKWEGITCSRRHSGRVIWLDLRSQKLQGTLSPYIGNLTFLFGIRLENNSFHGVIPQEIGGLHRLQDLTLSNNSFTNEIPVNLINCSDLRYLYLNANNLSGNILSTVSFFPKIVQLILELNYFSGFIPSSLGNSSSLTMFTISHNHMEGSIPGDLCRIPGVVYFNVGSNNLTGTIPSCLYNQSNLMYLFSVCKNQLEGSIPSDIGFTLPKIQNINLWGNKFSGPIPTSLPNATNLEVIEFQVNTFTGSLPTDLGRLQRLRQLSFHLNQLGTRTGDDLKFITSLTNCTNLQVLQFGGNLLKGPLPVSISNLSSNFRSIRAQDNMLFGNIPSGLGNLVSMEILDLKDNVFSGPIPASLGNLTKLAHLYLGDNKLEGSIPPTLGNCISLLRLDISYNNIVGTIPSQLFQLQLIGLDLNYNAITGSLPSQISNLTKLVELYLSSNKLSGHLPESLSNCLSLEQLFLDNNNFQGEIPNSFQTLRGLRDFDISQNNFSGEIPDFLEQLPLQYLNLSFNHLEGKVPETGVFRNTSAFSVDGNINICGGIHELKLLSCMQKQKGKKSSPSIKVIIPIIIGSLCFLAFSCMLLMSCKRKTLKRQSSSRTNLNLSFERVSYGELFKATDEFSNENLIGEGSHGSVYKGVLEHINKTVAVKVIKLHLKGASKSFLRECDALRNLRHRNLLKVITVCSSVDFKGIDFKALVFDFMPNGSLEGWLHARATEQQIVSRFLDFMHRVNIAIDVASALEYLHHHCQPYVVHCDVKPSNVLLDDDMNAHVADFGIAKIFFASDSTQRLASSVVIKGSIGYVPPEYGVGGEASTQGDVYSYGILLLEMFTGKKPTDDMFVNGLSLHDYAKMTLPDHVIDIIDPVILCEEDDVQNTVEQSETRGKLYGSLVSITRIALICSDGLPVKRMTMSEVVTELQHIKEHYLRI